MVSNSTRTAENRSAVDTAMDKIIELLKKQKAETQIMLQRRIQAHIREVFKVNVNLAILVKDTAIKEEQKRELLKTIWIAVTSNRLDLLKGQVAFGDKNLVEGTGLAQAPTPPPRTTTVPKAKVTASKVEVKPAAPAAPPKAATPAAPTGDDPKIVTIVNNILAAKAGEWKTTMLDVVKHALGNGEFPVDRVKEIVQAELSGITLPAKQQQDGTVTPASYVHKAIEAAFVPEINPDYIISDEHAKLMNDYDLQAKEEGYAMVQLVGPHGCGKSEFAVQLAARFKRPILIIDCANIRERRDWFGYWKVINGNLVWVESEFVRVLKMGNCVICWDELNRIAPEIVNPMMPLWDWRRATLVEESGEHIKMGPNIICMATLNEGYQYTGTTERDPAHADRWTDRLELTYLTELKEVELLQAKTGIDEITARRLVGLANGIREKAVGSSATYSKSVSTRMLLAAARRFRTMGVAGLTPTILNHFSAEPVENSERNAVAQMIQGKFGTV